jgi:hypothetical protein
VHCDAVVHAWPAFSVHVPGLAPLQVPFGHEVEPQHTPSTHARIEPHAVADAHGFPRFASAWHWCEAGSQKFPDEQSASAAHDVRHAVAPHTYGVQPPSTFGLHLPPEHVPALVKTPPVHAFEPHDTEEFGSSHVARVKPSQLETLHVGSVPTFVHCARVPCGCCFAGTGEQVPTRPLTSHASHWPVHAELQHTPSAQLPVAHGVPDTQVEPSLMTQLPRCDGSLQTPPVGQPALPQQTPSTQLPLVHCAPAVQVVPVARSAAQCPVESQ